MPGYVQLDKAARQAGKSEVTIRRLIKAGKISHRKEKTLTGFIYLIDPEEVLSYYGRSENEGQNVTVGSEEPDNPGEDSQPKKAAQQVRVAVAGESGSLTEYWQKRAEAYEERYHRELSKHSQMREELGAWRGRAEQAQNMLMKLLPAPTVPPESVTPPVEPVLKSAPTIWLPVLISTAVTIIIVSGALFLLHLRG